MNAKRVTQPVGQVRLTNVAVVRYKRGGFRFEVAAYPNKVMNWRNRVEMDINQVLQVPTVFMNVSKGIHAKSADLIKAFGTDDHMQCALMILEKGTFEVSDLERQAQFEAVFRDIATMVAERCINPETMRAYPASMIEKALQDVHFVVSPSRPAKAQVIKAINQLQGYLPLERARMTLRLFFPEQIEMQFMHWIRTMSDDVLHREVLPNSLMQVDVLTDPGFLRVIEDKIKDGWGVVLAGEDGTNMFPGIAPPPDKDPSVPADRFVTLKSQNCRVEVISLSSIPLDRKSSSNNDMMAESPSTDESPVQSASASQSANMTASMDSLDIHSASARGTGMATHRITKPSGRMTCNTCNIEFEDREQFRSHQRSEVHRYNLKRKLKSMDPVSFEEFEAIPEKEKQAFLDSDV